MIVVVLLLFVLKFMIVFCEILLCLSVVFVMVGWFFCLGFWFGVKVEFWVVECRKMCLYFGMFMLLLDDRIKIICKYL